MTHALIAKATIHVDAPRTRLWTALTDPRDIRAYMFGTEIVTEWKVGGPIVWKGTWQGKSYEDKGELLAFEPGRLLRYSHFSPLAGKPDTPENRHVVTVRLEDEAGGTRVTLEQDHNADEEALRHSEKNWKAMLEGLKRHVEGAG